MPWDWLLPWRRRRASPRAVILFTRQGCHLCEDVQVLLQRLQREYCFSLTEVDVDTDPVLAAEHGEHVPVVAIDGRVCFRGVVNPVLLRRLFAGRGEP